MSSGYPSSLYLRYVQPTLILFAITANILDAYTAIICSLEMGKRNPLFFSNFKSTDKRSPQTTAEPSTSPSPHCPFPVPTLQVLQSAVLLSGRKSSGHNTVQTVHLFVDLVSMHHQSFATHYKYLNKVQHMQCLSIPVVITHSELWMLQPSAYPCFLGHKECIEGHMSRHWPA